MLKFSCLSWSLQVLRLHGPKLFLMTLEAVNMFKENQDMCEK